MVITNIDELNLKVKDRWAKGILRSEIVAGNDTLSSPRFTKELSVSIWDHDELGFGIHIDQDTWLRLTGNGYITDYQNVELLRMSQVTLTELKGIRDTLSAFIDAFENNTFNQDA